MTLSSQGYTVIECCCGRDAVSKAIEDKPELIILDLGLPDVDGIEVTRLIRKWSRVPIIILSVHGAEGSKIQALDAGADDYLTKPFNVGELLARLRAALRRVEKTADDPIFTSGHLKVDLTKRLVTVNGCETGLTPNEYELLRILIKNGGKVLTRRYLLQEVWGPEYGDEFHMLHVNISNLRKKIESDPARPQLVITEPGVGYRLRAGD